MHSQEIPQHWEVLGRSSTELTTDEDYSLVNTWYKSSMIKNGIKEEDCFPVQEIKKEKKKVIFERNVF